MKAQTYPIKKGIAIPLERQRGGRRKSAFNTTLEQMKVGDCMDLPLTAYKVKASMYQIASRVGAYITIRIVSGENGEREFYRVWKVGIRPPKHDPRPQKHERLLKQFHDRACQ